MTKIDLSWYIHLGFCYGCPYLSETCSDSCELYSFLTHESMVKRPSDYCRNFCNNQCDECRINKVDQFKLIHARDIILDTRWQEELSLRSNGVTIHEQGKRTE